MATLTCQIVTPSAAVLDEQASYVTFQAFDGQQGVMAGSSAFLSRLGSGTCRIDTASGSSSFVLSGGFAQMNANKLVLLADAAETIASINHEGALKKLGEANAAATAVPAKPSTLAHREEIERAQSVARARVAASRRH